MNRGFDAAMAAQRIRRLGIRPRARISALSGGERAQVALTLVLAKKPELFLLDEPMANLDPLARREFLGSMFTACSETGATGSPATSTSCASSTGSSAARTAGPGAEAGR